MSMPAKFCILLPGFIFYCYAICAQPNKPVNGKTYAIIVGITNYQNAAVKSLDYADKDAVLFAAYLKSKAGGAVPEEQIKLFTNEEASIAAIYQALDWIKEQTTKDDLVYFYFSGHGDVEIDSTNISKGFLLAYNSPPNNYINNAISVESINSFANSITTKNGAKLVLITDACRSGKLAGDYYKGKQLTAENLRAVLNNQVRLASCSADELAAEGPFWGNGRGVFSYYLLRGLNGLADLIKDGIIKLEELETFLDSSFTSDKDLNRDNHKQHPVFDGSPIFPLALVDSATAKAVEDGSLKFDTLFQQIPNLPVFFNPVPDQPIDYFFSLFKEYSIDKIINSGLYFGVANDSIPLKMIDHLQLLPRQLDLKIDSLQLLIKANTEAQNKIYAAYNRTNKDSIKLLKYYDEKIDSMTRRTDRLIKQQESISYQIPYIDTTKIALLKTQLLRNKSTTKRFIEKFINLVHEKAQDMINAYLKGDLAELEKRQYYYSGKGSYGDLLPSMQLAIQLIPENNQLARVFSTQYSYVSGLTARMKMSTSNRSDSLLAEAFHYQYEALKKEPYAAYIHNELGNLFMHKQSFDSAQYHYRLAKILAPAWAIPWSNFIRLNLATNNIEKAKEAIYIADSLQPNLAYVNINAGLIMEKEKNWLAAESYYLNAIAQNNVHYLPLERLGNIYITTGNYAKADSFLYEANKRKNEFTVNEQVFRFGIELGGEEKGQPGEYYFIDCSLDSVNGLPEWQNLSLLLKALMEMEIPTHNMEDGKKFMNEVLQKKPDMPLAHHYLGKKYFEDGEWTKAEAALNKAISGYQLNPLLKSNVENELLNAVADKMKNSISISASIECMVNRLMYYSYDELEDHYLLGQVYEEMNLFDKALDQYAIITGIENRRQQKQAAFINYRPWEEDTFSFDNTEQQVLLAKYSNPIIMSGSLKSARLYEKMGEFEKAEQILLVQISQNRTAGYSRQSKMDSSYYGPANARTPFNYYWLNTNRDLEAYTYNFYKRMLSLFPRESNWYKNAGLFLHQRLYLTYRQLPVANRPAFYEYSLGYAYPFAGSVDGPYQDFDDNNILKTSSVNYKLPGTNEEIKFDLLNYDPVMEALKFLQQSVKLSGDLKAEFSVQEKIADLQSWMGKAGEAIESLNDLVLRQPDNTAVRNKLVDILTVYNRYPLACEQLKILNGQGKTTNKQKLELANYEMLAGKTNDAVKTLTACLPANDSEKNYQMLLFAKANWLSENPKNALLYLKDSVKEIILPEGDYYYGEEELAKDMNNARLYSIARMYAIRKKEQSALSALKTAIDSGFNYRYVISNDRVWEKYRDKKSWNQLFKEWNRGNINELYIDIPAYREQVDYNPVHYRIPKLQPEDN